MNGMEILRRTTSQIVITALERQFTTIHSMRTYLLHRPSVPQEVLKHIFLLDQSLQYHSKPYFSSMNGMETLRKTKYQNVLLQLQINNKIPPVSQNVLAFYIAHLSYRTV
ncbi:hypothetical protein AVEN_143363-1 [Araneus ventricosus]|uniref:Uncharacterized protein n=1 Tax=Araneus ventricosus TaxID=182803 RepID=A0A4Y2AEB6_ARAVE|nr:hypothetical protein AVEN_143363-1 [Araneus ventricosus]